MGIIDDTDIARRRAEGEQPIIEQIRELVGDPHASVTIVLDEDAWGFDNHEDNASYNAEMLTEAKLDWEGIEMADMDRGHRLAARPRHICALGRPTPPPSNRL